MTINFDSLHFSIPSGFAASHFNLRELRATFSFAFALVRVKSGTRENVPLVKLHSRSQIS